MPHTSDHNRPPRRSIFQSPRHPSTQLLAQTESSPPFSDGSHSLRRSLNVAQNLSRLAETTHQPMISQLTGSSSNNNSNNYNTPPSPLSRLSSWSQHPRIGHSHAIVGLTTSLAGSIGHSVRPMSSSSGTQTFQHSSYQPQTIHPNVVVRTATPAFSNYSDRMASMRDSVMEQMRMHVQNQQQPQQQPQQWHQDDSNNYTMPRDGSESQELDTESEEEEEEEEEEGRNEDMELDEHDIDGDHSRYYGQQQIHGQGNDYGQQQYYSSQPSGETPLMTRVHQNFATHPQGSTSPPPAQPRPPSHRHPQQLPSSRRIIIPPQEVPTLSLWSRQSSVSSGYSSQSSNSQNQQLQQLQQPQYNQRHPQQMDRRRNRHQQTTPDQQQQQYTSSRQSTQSQGRQSMSEGTMTVETPQHQQQQHQQRPAFMSQPVYQLACAACIRPLCLRAMKAVMLSDHSKELYSTDMPPAGLQLVNDDRQVRHCSCRIRDSACLGCGQVAGYHVTQPCSDCLKDQNNGHFWMFYSSAVVHYKRLRLDGHVGDVMLWANVPSINHDQALAQQLRREVPMLSVRTSTSHSTHSQQGSNGGGSNSNTDDERPLTACVEMEEWLNSPMIEVVCR